MVQEKGSTTRSTGREFLDVSDAGYFAEFVREFLGTLQEAPAGSVAIINQDGLLTFSPWLRFLEDTKLLAVGGDVNSQLHARLGANFAATANTTLANIAPSASQPLSVDVVKSGVYKLHAKLFTTSAITGGIKAALGGTCTLTSGIYEAVIRQAGLTVVPTTTRVNSATLSTPIGEITAVTTATITLEGLLVIASAGTLTLQFAQNASDAGASTVLAGSYLQLTPMS